VVDERREREIRELQARSSTPSLADPNGENTSERPQHTDRSWRRVTASDLAEASDADLPAESWKVDRWWCVCHESSRPSGQTPI
jgi:hypothetical protein